MKFTPIAFIGVANGGKRLRALIHRILSVRTKPLQGIDFSISVG
jgi:hypothetical protein